METVQIAGFEFARHPSHKNITQSEERRLSAIVESLAFSASQCTPPERAMYLAIIRAQAMVMGARDRAKEALRTSGREPKWLSEAFER